jgi:hypothetical protein
LRAQQAKRLLVKSHPPPNSASVKRRKLIMAGLALLCGAVLLFWFGFKQTLQEGEEEPTASVGNTLHPGALPSQSGQIERFDQGERRSGRPRLAKSVADKKGGDEVTLLDGIAIQSELELAIVHQDEFRVSLEGERKKIVDAFGKELSLPNLDVEIERTEVSYEEKRKTIESVFDDSLVFTEESELEGAWRLRGSALDSAGFDKHFAYLMNDELGVLCSASALDTEALERGISICESLQQR